MSPILIFTAGIWIVFIFRVIFGDSKIEIIKNISFKNQPKVKVSYESSSQYIEKSLSGTMQSQSTFNAIEELPLALDSSQTHILHSELDDRFAEKNEVPVEMEVAYKLETIFKETNQNEIAINPNINDIEFKKIDISQSIKLNQERLVKHQEIVRLLASEYIKYGFVLFKGKFDCVATKNNVAILNEVKTIIDTSSDEEKQSVKAIGQLKYYKFKIEQLNLGFSKTKEVIVFSNKPDQDIIDFFSSENIIVVWLSGNEFQIFNKKIQLGEKFFPNTLLLN